MAARYRPPLRTSRMALLACGLILTASAVMAAWSMTRTDPDPAFFGAVAFAIPAAQESYSDVSRDAELILATDVGDGTTEVELQLRVHCGDSEYRSAIVLWDDAMLDRVRAPTLSPGVEWREVATRFGLPGTTHGTPVQVLEVATKRNECPASLGEGVTTAAFTVHRIVGTWERPVLRRYGMDFRAVGPIIGLPLLEHLAVARSALGGQWASVESKDYQFIIAHSLSSAEEVIGSPPGLVSSRPLTWRGTTLDPDVRWSNRAGDDRRIFFLFSLGALSGLGASLIAGALFPRWG